MVNSYNGWPASKNPKAIGVNSNWAPLGHKFPGGVKAGNVEKVFTYLVVQLDARVEPIDRDAVKDEWGYVYKQSANSNALLSCHSSATAIDYNATRHPNGRRGTWTPQQVKEIRKILAELGGVIHWLGDAKGTPDEMHFEVRATPAQVAAVAARLQDQPAPTPEPESPTSEEDDMPKLYEPQGHATDSGGAWLVVAGCLPYAIPNPSYMKSAVTDFGPAQKVSAASWDLIKSAIDKSFAELAQRIKG